MEGTFGEPDTHFEGSGYPDGLIGEAIPLEARIIGVPDAFDAMTSLRPHREAMPLKEALKEMEEGRSKQFDPQVLRIFLREKIYKSERCGVPTVDENIRNGNCHDDGSN